MKRRFSDMVPALLLWAMLSIFLWSFVFNFLTDVPASEKLVLFIDAPLTEETRLAVQLEDVADEHIQMVQVRSFDYAMMSSHEIENADLYIIGESAIADYADWFAPLPEALRTGTLLERDGQPVVFCGDGSPKGAGISKAGAPCSAWRRRRWSFPVPAASPWQPMSVLPPVTTTTA